jgi:hypothetical protein
MNCSEDKFITDHANFSVCDASTGKYFFIDSNNNFCGEFCPTPDEKNNLSSFTSLVKGTSNASCADQGYSIYMKKLKNVTSKKLTKVTKL